MLTALLPKIGFPALSLVIGIASGMAIHQKLQKPITIPEYNCPPCNCPPQANTIDFDKIKGFKGTITLNQHYAIAVDGDSLVIEQFKKAVAEEMNKLKLSRCK